MLWGCRLVGWVAVLPNILNLNFKPLGFTVVQTNLQAEVAEQIKLENKKSYSLLYSSFLFSNFGLLLKDLTIEDNTSKKPKKERIIINKKRV